MHVKNKVFRIFFCIGICQLAGVVGSIFTRTSVDTWYRTLDKPVFNPPSWVFAPVWILLYLMMGIALYRIWEYKISYSKTEAMIIFYIQLFINSLWSIAFFGMKSPLLGLIVIVLLLILIAVTLFKFYKISKTAGVLLIPYLLWVSFATLLNFELYRLN